MKKSNTAQYDATHELAGWWKHVEGHPRNGGLAFDPNYAKPPPKTTLQKIGTYVTYGVLALAFGAGIGAAGSALERMISSGEGEPAAVTKEPSESKPTYPLIAIEPQIEAQGSEAAPYPIEPTPGIPNSEHTIPEDDKQHSRHHEPSADYDSTFEKEFGSALDEAYQARQERWGNTFEFFGRRGRFVDSANHLEGIVFPDGGIVRNVDDLSEGRPAIILGPRANGVGESPYRGGQAVPHIPMDPLEDPHFGTSSGTDLSDYPKRFIPDENHQK